MDVVRVDCDHLNFSQRDDVKTSLTGGHFEGFFLEIVVTFRWLGDDSDCFLLGVLDLTLCLVLHVTEEVASDSLRENSHCMLGA